VSFLQNLFGTPSVEQLEAEGEVEELISTLSERREQTCAAIAALGRLVDERAVDPLVAVLDDDVRKAAITALGEIGDARAVEPLAKLLVNESPPIQRAAARALGNIGDSQAISSLVDAVHEGAAPKVAARAIVQIDAEPVKHLAPMLQAQDMSVRWAAAEALSEVGAPAVPSLVEMLQDADSGAHAPAAWALGEIEDPRAVPLLTKLLDHPKAKARKVAAVELGRMEDDRAVDPLSKALDMEQDDDVREAMIDALEAITGNSWDENGN
jgi:HEAT repeat protein